MINPKPYPGGLDGLKLIDQSGAKDPLDHLLFRV